MQIRALVAEFAQSVIVAVTLVAFYLSAIRVIRSFAAREASLTPGVTAILVVLAAAGGCALVYGVFTYWYAREAGHGYPGFALLAAFGRPVLVSLLIWAGAIAAVAALDAALIDWIGIVDPEGISGTVLYGLGLVVGIAAGFATLSYYHYRRSVREAAGG